MLGKSRAVGGVAQSFTDLVAIKTKVTELGGCAEVINEQAYQLREEIKEALVCIEESIRSARKEKPTLGSVVLMDKTASSN
jgi:hypothetical protein